MTKVEQIMSLYDGIRTTREIANIVGCRPEYVRVVARQRNGSGSSDTDRRYRESSIGKAVQRKSYIKNKSVIVEASKAYQAVVLKTGDRDVARMASRVAYQASREQGKSVRDAGAIASRVYQRSLRNTADKPAARSASRQAYREAAAHLEAAE